ncbi:YheC/YheD family protein [Ammoniphilus sp. YIM 78166]|uniref:YheC/YheD family protein n=1 Tax=Ammoniphilus sp. YIM 78166 TaxID=1644106 RepID=UPI00106F3F6E|nr:YheC/YheD family protein [Ammoniphilus sp. YIM 78166]
MELLSPNTPLIGICISKNKKAFRKLIKRRLECYSEDINVVSFYIEGLDFQQHHVIGHLYQKKGDNITKLKGKFPFPHVVYLQCFVDPDTVKKIEDLIGPKVFNSFIFDKYQCVEMLAKDTSLVDHIPKTWKLKDLMDLQEILNSQEDVFLKSIDPIKSHSSKGIYRLRRSRPSHIQVSYGRRGKMTYREFGGYEEFVNWASPILSMQPFILQQSIETVLYQNKVTDIRLNMNKNSFGQWDISALLYRVSTNDSHLYYSLSKLLDLKKINEEWAKAIVDVGYKICNVLDQSGVHMADLGIDLGIDNNEHIWIFEVNPLPFPFDLSRMKDDSIVRPLDYAVYLSSQ